MFPVLLGERWGVFREGRFLGKVVDEWAADTQEFIHTRLPHLVIVFAIAFLLSRLLGMITRRMIRVAEQHGAGAMRMGQVKTLSGVIRATGYTVIGVITGLQFLDAVGLNLGPLAGLGRHRRSGDRPGRAKHRQGHAQRHPHPDRGPVQRGRHGAHCRTGRNGGGHDLAQDHGARRRRHAVRDSQLTDHHRGQPEHRLLGGHRQRERGLLSQPRRGAGAADHNRHRGTQQRGIPRRFRRRPAGSGRGRHQRFRAHLPGGLQDPGQPSNTVRCASFAAVCA